LSGASQPQYQNPGQAVWANANQRAVQHTPVQRPQQQHNVNQTASAQTQQQSQPTQDSLLQNSDDLFSTASHFPSSIDDYRHGGQGGVGQLSGSSQPQTGNIEEFPPLGRNGNEESEQDRRGSLMQNAAFGGFSNADAFTLPQTSAQTRQGLPNAPNNQGDNNRPSVLVDRILSPSTLGFGGKSCNIHSTT
jgi:CCR4-NOT transcription complex subunit 2